VGLFDGFGVYLGFVVFGPSAPLKRPVSWTAPGDAAAREWSLAWPERVAGVAGSLVNFAVLVSLGLPGVRGGSVHVTISVMAAP
jgi:hypothetical protein